MNWKKYILNGPCLALKFNDWKLRLYGIPLLTLISFPSFHHKSSLGILVEDLFISLIVTILYWYTSRSIILIYRRRLPLMEQYFKRMVLQIFTIIISNIFLFLLLGLFLASYRRAHFDQVNLAAALFTPLAFTFIIVLIYESIYLLQEWKEAALIKEVSHKEQISTQLKAFQNQTNPHFLFNSLNTLSSFIQDKPQLAQKYVNKLAEIYRYILNIHDQEIIQLKEELDFLDDYFYLMQIRYGQNLKLKIQINAADKSKNIIPLALQALVENAIKHNVISKEKQLEIKIFSDNKFITIQNKIQPKINTRNDSNGTGIANITKRYELLTNQIPIISKDHGTFTVKLPLININEYPTS